MSSGLRTEASSESLSELSRDQNVERTGLLSRRCVVSAGESLIDRQGFCACFCELSGSCCPSQMKSEKVQSHGYRRTGTLCHSSLCFTNLVSVACIERKNARDWHMSVSPAILLQMEPGVCATGLHAHDPLRPSAVYGGFDVVSCRSRIPIPKSIYCSRAAIVACIGCIVSGHEDQVGRIGFAALTGSDGIWRMF